MMFKIKKHEHIFEFWTSINLDLIWDDILNIDVETHNFKITLIDFINWRINIFWFAMDFQSIPIVDLAPFIERNQ